MVHRLCESDGVIVVVPHFKLFVGVYVVLTVNLVLLFGKFYRLQMDDHFEVVFHHGGKFINDGSLKYMGDHPKSPTLNMWTKEDFLIQNGNLKH